MLWRASDEHGNDEYGEVVVGVVVEVVVEGEVEGEVGVIFLLGKDWGDEYGVSV